MALSVPAYSLDLPLVIPASMPGEACWSLKTPRGKQEGEQGVGGTGVSSRHHSNSGGGSCVPMLGGLLRVLPFPTTALVSSSLCMDARITE